MCVCFPEMGSKGDFVCVCEKEQWKKSTPYCCYWYWCSSSSKGDPACVCVCMCGAFRQMTERVRTLLRSVRTARGRENKEALAHGCKKKETKTLELLYALL